MRRKLAQLGRAQKRQVRCIEGAPAPLRAHSHWAGSWTGVLIATDLQHDPSLCPGTPASLRPAESPRPGTSSMVRPSLRRPSTASHPTYPDARALTDRLLATITREIVVGLQGGVPSWDVDGGPWDGGWLSPPSNLLLLGLGPQINDDRGVFHVNVFDSDALCQGGCLGRKKNQVPLGGTLARWLGLLLPKGQGKLLRLNRT